MRERFTGWVCVGREREREAHRVCVCEREKGSQCMCVKEKG